MKYCALAFLNTWKIPYEYLVEVGLRHSARSMKLGTCCKKASSLLSARLKESYKEPFDCTGKATKQLLRPTKKRQILVLKDELGTTLSTDMTQDS